MIRRKKQEPVRDDTLVAFKYADAQRIARAVFAHETARRGRKPSTLPRASGGGGGGGGGVVEATFTGGWLKDAVKQITFVADTTNTARAINLLRSIPITNDGSPRLAFVALRPSPPAPEGDDQYVLINAEC